MLSTPTAAPPEPADGGANRPVTGRGARRQAAAERARAVIARHSPWRAAFYGAIFESTLRRGAHAVRIAQPSPVEALAAPKLVIYCNHPAWWDGVLLLVLARRLFAPRVGFAPIEAAMLDRYPFMSRIGAFGVTETARGAADFLAAGKAVLDAGHVLAVTAQGQFADARERPLGLRPGLAHLPAVAPDGVFLPMAVEFAFWEERRFEALVRFGAPLAGADLAPQPVAARLHRLKSALEETMDALARDSVGRRAEAFSLLLGGSAGIHPAFDAWDRLKAAWSGRRYAPGHAGGAR